MIINLVKEIRQIDNQSFNIIWTDEKVSLFKLSFLQSKCPCSFCLKGFNNVEEGVRAFRIKSVGCFALQIDFTSGCSKGIFTFSFLRELSLEDM
ncbi:MAG: DUF971 domain-containing protein [Verrucomicrobia bacterium]|nr:DUF971 domain-containing protein [Verrucomicrobiota bacterium]